MQMTGRGLGTQLRHLLELLDGAVERTYAELGLDYRPRYTPVMRALIDRGPCTVGEIAAVAGITQPAATQTIARMVGAGLVSTQSGKDDGRQRVVRLTRRGRELVPALQACWHCVAQAAAGLEADMSLPLSRTLECAIAALQNKSFDQRITEARVALEPKNALPKLPNDEDHHASKSQGRGAASSSLPAPSPERVRGRAERGRSGRRTAR